MTPSHAVKKGARYRYYVSRPLITNDQSEGSAGLRIPAVEIEQLVTSRVRQWLLDTGSVYQATSAQFLVSSTQRRLVSRAQEIGKRWPELPMMRRRALLNALIDRIAVGVDRIDIRLRSAGLGELLDVAATPLPSLTDDDIRILSIPIRLRRSGSEIRMLIDGTDPFATAKPDARLIKLLLKARRLSGTLVGSDGVPFAALAGGRRCQPVLFHPHHSPQLSRPRHHQAILDGRQPRDLTADKLLVHSRLPLAWPDQRTALGFAEARSKLKAPTVSPRRPTSLALRY